MTTSELEKWIIEFMNREDFDENYGDDSLAELVERGFLHTIEVLEKKVFLAEFKEKDPNVLAGYINAIRFLKQYTDEQPRTEDSVRERSRNKGEHE